MSEEITLVAETNFRNQKVKFGIKTDDRRRHMYLIGKTGMGKSTVLENMIIQDIRYGNGIALVDPHGDFAEKILHFIPPNRINDIVYFNPSDIDFPIAFNVMEAVEREHKHLIASGLVGVFKKLWADSWGPRLEYVLRNTVLALLDYPGSTLLGVMRMLTDKNYRKKVIAKIQDPVVKAFWVEEYSKYPDRFQSEAIAPIQNKVGQFLSTALIRNIVGQVTSTIDIREIMDQGKILIMNLSKGRIGEDSSALLGAMMITKIQLAAMSRIDIPETERRDFYLYVDEFQNFATESFANILSEARKYRLNLIIAHQYIEQLDEIVRPAVFGNVGTIMTFRVGAEDAEYLVKEFAPYFTEEDLVNLTKFDVYIKLMIDGVSSNPFSATTLPPLENTNTDGDIAGKVIRVSRERYAKPREVVEEKIARWSGMRFEEEIRAQESSNIKQNTKEFKKIPPEKTDVKTSHIVKSPASLENIKNTPSPQIKRVVISDKTRRNKIHKKSEKMIIACYECGDPVEVNFKPDGVRPIYCKKCFQDLRMIPLKNNANEETPNTPKEMSLEEAMNKNPVNFQGREIKKQAKVDEKKSQEKEFGSAQNTQTKVLLPGKVIKF